MPPLGPSRERHRADGDSAPACVDTGAREACNGLDDDCDGRVDTIGALHFAGAGDAVLADQSADLVPVQAFTLEAWVSADAGEPDGELHGVVEVVASDQSYACVYVDRDGALRGAFVAADGTRAAKLDASTPLLASTWTHVALVYDDRSAGWTLFMAGRPLASATATSFAAGSGHLAAGAFVAQGAYIVPIAGTVADVRLSTGALYSEAFRPDAWLDAGGGAIVLWPLDEGSGGSAVDATGHAHDGAIVGASWGDADCRS